MMLTVIQFIIGMVIGLVIGYTEIKLCDFVYDIKDQQINKREQE